MSNTQSNQSSNANNRQVQQAPSKTSALDRLSLGFEYNMTLKEIKQEIRLRTI